MFFMLCAISGTKCRYSTLYPFIFINKKKTYHKINHGSQLLHDKLKIGQNQQ
jgi:hypothetical protein